MAPPGASGQFVQWWACYLLLGAAFYYFSSPLVRLIP